MRKIIPEDVAWKIAGEMAMKGWNKDGRHGQGARLEIDVNGECSISGRPDTVALFLSQVNLSTPQNPGPIPNRSRTV